MWIIYDISESRSTEFLICLYTIFWVFSWGLKLYTSCPARRGSCASLLGLGLRGQSLYFLINVRMMSWCVGDVYWVPRFPRAQSSKARVLSLALLSWLALEFPHSLQVRPQLLTYVVPTWPIIFNQVGRGGSGLDPAPAYLTRMMSCATA